MEAFLLWTALLLFGFRAEADEAKAWLTDAQVRDMVASTVHARFPEPCYSTYHNEHLERSVVRFRSNFSNGDNAGASVYFYRVASDDCDYVALEDGKPVRRKLVTMDCCEYGYLVAPISIEEFATYFRDDAPADKRGDKSSRV